MRVPYGGIRGRVVRELRDQVARLARRAPHDGVDEPVPAVAVLLRELDRLAHGGVIGDTAEQSDLVDAEPKRVQQRQVDRPRPA
jgi:hypothetical protein